MKSQGQLIVFEGPDGVGKSTLANDLVAYLVSTGRKCVYLSFPGKEEGTLGHHVYQLHHNSEQFGITALNPTSLQILHVAAHVDAIENTILPLLKNGTVVVLDRFWWSTWVYGKVAGISQSNLEAILKIEISYWNEYSPAIVFLVSRYNSLKIEEDKNKFNKISSGYYELAELERKNYPVYAINNNDVYDDTFHEVISIVLEENYNKVSNVIDNIQMEIDFDDKSKIFTPSSLVISSFSPAQPTEVFDTYWKFAVERQNIFFHRVFGDKPPWTSDPILAKYKFTNAYRASDRVSQYLIKNVIYHGDQDPREVFFRIILFKIFNRIETWELLDRSVGGIHYGKYSFKEYDCLLSDTMERGISIFSGAYIMPSGGEAFGFSKKHRNYLHLLDLMMKDQVPERIIESRNMRDVFELLRDYPMIGDFLAYQYTIDINYSNMTNFSEMEFVVPGPGAKNGIRKCFHSLGGLNEVDIIRFTTDKQEREFERLGLEFKTLWGRDLQLIDCQNLFCEVDKYARVAHPDSKGVNDRKRIKQTYQGKTEPIRFWYPPKWGLNDLIEYKGDI
jgi:thymidylate kinase